MESDDDVDDVSVDLPVAIPLLFPRLDRDSNPRNFPYMNLHYDELVALLKKGGDLTTFGTITTVIANLIAKNYIENISRTITILSAEAMPTLQSDIFDSLATLLGGNDSLHCMIIDSKEDQFKMQRRGQPGYFTCHFVHNKSMARGVSSDLYLIIDEGVHFLEVERMYNLIYPMLMVHKKSVCYMIECLSGDQSSIQRRAMGYKNSSSLILIDERDKM